MVATRIAPPVLDQPSLPKILPERLLSSRLVCLTVKKGGNQQPLRANIVITKVLAEMEGVTCPRTRSCHVPASLMLAPSRMSSSSSSTSTNVRSPPALRWDTRHHNHHWPKNIMSTSSANLPGGRPASASASASASYFPQAEEIMLRPRRQLACVRCQQRKVKCDHKDPCATCVKAGVPCVTSNQVQRRRKRRLPERDLLDRIRKYEDLLTQHNIKFEPLHPRRPESSVSVPKGSPDSHVEEPCESDDEPGTTTASSHAGTSSPRRRVREAKYLIRPPPRN